MTDLPSYAMPDLWLDESHCLEFTTRQGETEPSGAIFWHRNEAKQELSATPGWCAGSFYWRASETQRFPWTLLSRDPLSISPSILCGCGEHGFIVDGKWVPA